MVSTLPSSSANQRPDPSRGWLLVVVVLLFLLPGTLQRGPWKQEDAIHFGIIWRAISSSGDWLHFHLSQSLVAEPPLYYWLARLTGELFGTLLEPAAAVRSATAVFVGVAVAALTAAARRFYRTSLPGAAALVLIGSLGLLVAGHDIQPLSAVLAAISILLYGLSRTEKPLESGLWIAVGVGGILLGSGLRLAPVLLVTAAAALASRRPGTSASITLGIAGGGALFAIWWLALYQQSPQVALTWFDHQVQSLWSTSDTPRNLWNELVTLSWFAWPAWPLAVYGLWVRRPRLLEHAYLVPLVMTAATLVALGLGPAVRQSWFILLLPPLSLLAVAGLEALRRGGASLLDWFGRMTFGLFLIFLLAGWSAMTFGWPEKWAAKSARWAPGYIGEVAPLAVIVSACAVGCWLWICLRFPRSPQKSLFAWTGGLTAFWIVLVALWFPWIDHQRSYKGVAAQASALVPSDQCIVARDFGEAQYALFDYYVQAPLLRRNPSTTQCNYVLTQAHPSIEIAPEGRWKRLWEGSRPGDKNERYRLYVRF